MKRVGFVVIACASLMLLLSKAGSAAGPETPEAVAIKALDVAKSGRFEEFAKLMHPDEMKQFRDGVMQMLDLIIKRGELDQFLEPFQAQGITSVEKLKSLDATKFFVAFTKATIPTPNKSAADVKVKVLGHVTEGKDRAHVVIRSIDKVSDLEVPRVTVTSFRKSGLEWKAMLLDGYSGMIAAMKNGKAGALIFPDLSATKIEVLGHLPDGKESEIIVFRSVTPNGDTPITKVAALRVTSKDPALVAVRAGRVAETKAVVEKSLGIGPKLAKSPSPNTDMRTRTTATATATATRSTTTTAGGMTSTSTATASASSSTTTSRGPEMSARPRGSIKPPPRTARTTPSRTQSRTARAPVSEEFDLPEGLTALPDKFPGNNRDRFQDIAPKGGVLVGVRVSYIPRFGGQKISSVQPIYRVGEKEVDGKRHGGLLGTETSVIAKPGYAVGAVNTHTALTVDGFELVFMKIDGERLNSSDSYHSPWLGDENGGRPRDVSSEGKIPVGLQGRAGKEVNALGLIVGSSEPAASKPVEKTDLGTLQGTWSETLAEVGGRKQPKNTLFSVKVIFEGDKVLAKVGRREPELRGTLKLDQGSKPKHYDLTTPEGHCSPAIYELDGDTLRVCISGDGEDRPKSFQTTLENQCTLVVYKRDEAAGK